MSFWSHFQSLSSTRSKLAESSLWDQQTHFYQHHGIASWDNRVPYQITNSVRFASIYAEALLAFAQDSREQGYTGPIRVVELGASHGQFMFYLLRHIKNTLPQTHLNLKDFSFHICDCSDKMIQFWRNQPQLKPFIENGTLNPHLFHIHQKEGIDTDLPLSKWHSDKMVLIANYFFDSLYQNAFIRDENQIYPLDVCIPDHGKDGLTPTQLEFVTDKDTPGETFYRNPLKNGILLDHIGPNVNRFLMPDAAMDIIDYFSDSVSQILILSSDKGYFDFTHHFYPDHLSFQADGSLSTTVNFFALNRFIEICHQGSSITPAPSLPTDRLIFSSCALLTHGDIQKFGRLYKLLHEHFHRYTFCDYHIHQNLLTDCITYKNLQSLLALFKKTQYDPFILTRLIEPLKTVIQSAPYYEPSWLKPMLNHFAENTYYIPSKVANLTFFTVARIATILRMPEEARELIKIHQELYGKNLHHYLLMGAHYFQLEDFKNAHKYYTQALQQDPDCPESIRHLELCENAIQT